VLYLRLDSSTSGKQLQSEVVTPLSPENRRATLPDGSIVELGAKTSVAVNFDKGRRAMQLSPGEAYFKVQPDKKRPFVVHAGDVEVTAIGHRLRR